MSEIASLGVKIDSTDATRAAGELDKLTAAGARTEKAINRLHEVAQRTAADMSALNGRVDTLNGTQNRMLAAVERVASQMDRMAASYERSARAAGSAARAYDQVGREASGSAANVDRMNRSLTQTESSAAAAGASIRRHLLVALSGLSVMRVIDMADEWGQMASRIRMATQSADEYERVQARMLQSANATYRNINETREAFIQLSPVLRQMGMSLEESMDAIDAFSGLLVVNSANAERGAAAMRALAVALQKGKLDANGWITIYSTVDSIVDVLAEHTGIAAEELRRLGAEGKLSVEMLAQSLVGQVQPIMQQVEGMPTTVRDALQRVGNAFGEYIGTANEANHVTATMARGIELVGEHMEGVMTVAIAAGTAGLARYAAGLAATVTQTTAQALQARIAAAEELRLAQAQMAAAQASVAQTAAMRGLTATMAQQTAAANALVAAEERLVAAKAGVAAAGRSVLGILAGPAGIAITAGLAATAFMTMGGSARAASADIDTLSSSLSDLTQKQLELRRVELEDQVASLEEKAIESSQALLGLHRDFDALYTSAAQGANITAAELENVKRTILEQEVAHEKNSAALDKARLLLDQVVGRLRDLELAARGAAGGVDGLNRAMGFTEAGEKYLAQIQARIKALQDGGDPVKAATRWILEHASASEADKAAIMSAALAEKALIEARERASKATKAGTQALNEAKKAAEAFERTRRQYLNGLYGEISALQDQARGLEDQIALYGLAESAKYDLAIADLEAQKAALAVIDAGAEEIAILERKIELLGQMRGSQQTLERLDAEKAAWESWARDVEQIFDRVGQSLTDAIFDGGKSGRDLLRDLFKGLTFNILINPVMNQMQGWVTNQLGGMFGYQNPQQQSGGGFSFGGGSTFGAGGVEMAGDWLLRSGLAPETGAKMLMNADKIAQIGGNVLGYGSAIYDLSQGKYASAALTAAGQAIGGPPLAMVGNFVGGIVDSFFDREPTTRREQRTQVEYAGGIFDITKTDDRAPAGADAAARALAEQAVATANDIFRQVGVDAAIDSFHAIMASSYKGDRDGVASGGMLRIGDEYRQFGIADEGNPTIQGFGGWSSAEMLPRLATDIQLSVLEAFQHVGDQLPSVLSSMLEGIDVRSLGEAEAQALAERFTALTQGAAAFLSTLETTPFAELRDLSFDAAAAMVQFAGGLDNLLASQQTYYERFYSEQEKFERSVELIGKALSEVGQEMPALTGSTEDMLASYRALAESLDLNTEAGQQAYVVLMQNAGAFADVAEFAGQAARERERLETQLLQVQGNTTELRQRELMALDESNRALQQHIWNLERQAQAANQLASIQNQVDQLLGNTAAIRAREMENILPENREWQQYLYDLQDWQQQVAEANARAQEDYQRELAAWNQLQQAVHDAFAEVRRVAQEELAKLREAARSTDSALSALSQRISAHERLIQDQISGLQGLLGGLRDVFDFLDEQVRDLRNDAGAGGMHVAQGWATINDAIRTGIVPAADTLRQAVSAVRDDLSERMFASSFDRDFESLVLANQLERLQDVTEPQMSLAEQQLEVSKQQLTRLEETLSEAQRIVNEARGIKDNTAGLQVSWNAYTDALAQTLDQSDGFESIIAAINAGTAISQQAWLEQVSKWDASIDMARMQHAALEALVDAGLIVDEGTQAQIDALGALLNRADDQVDLLRGVDVNTGDRGTAGEQVQRLQDLWNESTHQVSALSALVSGGVLVTGGEVGLDDITKGLLDELLSASEYEVWASAQIDGVNAQLEWASKQYDEFRGLNSKATTMIQALNNMASALSASQVAQPTNPGTTNPGTITPPAPPTTPTTPAPQTKGNRTHKPTTVEEGWDYLMANRDVYQALVHAALYEGYPNTPQSRLQFAQDHWLNYGRFEGRKYAKGGYYPGGLALVGEEGPEIINFARPGQVYTADQTQDILRNMGRGNDSGILQSILAENKALRAENKAHAQAIVQLNTQIMRILRQWDGNGIPETRELVEA